jgi:pilus assembly protein Flp/PilA
MKTILKLLRSNSGASAVEYALILAIVGTGIALAAVLLGDAVAGSMNDSSTCMSSNGNNCP